MWAWKSLSSGAPIPLPLLWSLLYISPSSGRVRVPHSTCLAKLLVVINKTRVTFLSVLLTTGAGLADGEKSHSPRDQSIRQEISVIKQIKK